MTNSSRGGGRAVGGAARVTGGTSTPGPAGGAAGGPWSQEELEEEVPQGGSSSPLAVSDHEQPLFAEVAGGASEPDKGLPPRTALGLLDLSPIKGCPLARLPGSRPVSRCQRRALAAAEAAAATEAEWPKPQPRKVGPRTGDRWGVHLSPRGGLDTAAAEVPPRPPKRLIQNLWQPSTKVAPCRPGLGDRAWYRFAWLCVAAPCETRFTRTETFAQGA